MTAGQLLEYGRKPAGVTLSIIGRHAHAHQYHFPIVAGGQGHESFQVCARRLERQSAQSVVGSQLEDDDGRSVGGQHVLETSKTARGGLAADAGINDLESVPFVLHAVRQQTYPAFIDRDAITGAEAVPVHQDQWFLVRLTGRCRRRPR